jgi:hypothetical protein
MTAYRYEIDAFAGPGTERLIDGSSLILVRVRMFDQGVDRPQEDVCCDLRPGEARELALRLLASAERAQQLTRLTPRSRRRPRRCARNDEQHHSS